VQVKTKPSSFPQNFKKKLDCKMFYAVSRFEIVFVRDAFQEIEDQKSYFQPLTILEIEAVHKNKGTLENFKEIKRFGFSFHSFGYLQKHHGVISEMLHHSIHEEETNQSFTF
jgi:DNA repair protein RecO (recombination protein O)